MKMNDAVRRSEENDDSLGNPHVGKESQAVLRQGDVDLILGKLRGVLEGLANVRFFKVWILTEDFAERRPVSNLSNDERNGNAHPADACSTAKNLWIECDSIERHWADIAHGYSSSSSILPSEGTRQPTMRRGYLCSLREAG